MKVRSKEVKERETQTGSESIYFHLFYTHHYSRAYAKLIIGKIILK